jgi:chaperonin cofactor prefoldin
MSDQDHPDHTRRIDPDATRRVDPPGQTQRIEPGDHGGLAGGPSEPWEGTADPDAARTGEVPADDALAEEEVAGAPDRRGRDAAFGIGGLVLGFLIAVVVIALGTSDRTDDGDVTAASDQVEALEADLDERDARIEALEAQLAEAEAAAGASADDVEAQRRALDERAAALDARVEAIDERSQALDRREAELDERARELEEREQQADEPGGDGTGADAGDGEGLLPELDTEEVETFIDRLLDRIRDLF